MKPTIALVATAAALLATACGGAAATSSGGSAATSSGSGAYGASTPASTPAAGGGAAVIKTGSGAPGTFLVDGKGQALYLWVADHGMSSTCSGECATDWPPLTTTGAPKASGNVKAALLGTTKRSDGTLEVTYAGHPLYTFAGDSSAGQVNGQGSSAFGADWWVVDAQGQAITH
jgi:predicted lipoprotein with Yx(FWY)xxD motif